MHVCLCVCPRERDSCEWEMLLLFLWPRGILSTGRALPVVLPWRLHGIGYFLSLCFVSRTHTRRRSRIQSVTHIKEEEGTIHRFSVPLSAPKQQHKLRNCNARKQLVAGLCDQLSCCNASRVNAEENRSLLYGEIFPNHITVGLPDVANACQCIRYWKLTWAFGEIENTSGDM